jgi:hypothetical protein
MTIILILSSFTKWKSKWPSYCTFWLHVLFRYNLVPEKPNLVPSTTTVVYKRQLAKLCRGFLVLPEQTKIIFVEIAEVCNLLTFLLRTIRDYISLYNITIPFFSLSHNNLLGNKNQLAAVKSLLSTFRYELHHIYWFIALLWSQHLQCYAHTN